MPPPSTTFFIFTLNFWPPMFTSTTVTHSSAALPSLLFLYLRSECWCYYWVPFCRDCHSAEHASYLMTRKLPRYTLHAEDICGQCSFFWHNITLLVVYISPMSGSGLSGQWTPLVLTLAWCQRTSWFWHCSWARLASVLLHAKWLEWSALSVSLS